MASQCKWRHLALHFPVSSAKLQLLVLDVRARTPEWCQRLSSGTGTWPLHLPFKEETVNGIVVPGIMLPWSKNSLLGAWLSSPCSSLVSCGGAADEVQERGFCYSELVNELTGRWMASDKDWKWVLFEGNEKTMCSEYTDNYCDQLDNKIALKILCIEGKPNQVPNNQVAKELMLFRWEGLRCHMKATNSTEQLRTRDLPQHPPVTVTSPQCSVCHSGSP